ncbi:MAG: O-antigen ligase family protein [Ktedonobacteraceae bacterium]|nr:O-antigen ligase family protein [Ktedonobacteraceae bacterium]
MSNHDVPVHLPTAMADSPVAGKTGENDRSPGGSGGLPGERGHFLTALSPFWHDRLIEAGMILSMALYYIVGNNKLGTGELFHVNFLVSLPFLLIFAALCWYRLPFAVALLPLALPYYGFPKIVFSHYDFSLTETALVVCLVVALLQAVLWRRRWTYWLSWQELRQRLGPLSIPMAVFGLAAAFSIVVAYDRRVALRDFREEILEPLLYVLLALYCLRSRQDVLRLLGALLATGVVVALLGAIQYILFKGHAAGVARNLRVDAIYGSGNSIGLLFDYVFPLGLALIVVQWYRARDRLGAWWSRLLALALCLLMVFVLYESQSGGAWAAIPIALLFIVACSIRNRKVLLTGGIVAMVALIAVIALLHGPITRFLFERHVSANGVSTLTKRIYLWESALAMIRDNPVTGYGLGNWLCHYSRNTLCDTPQLHHYWITTIPGTHASTGLHDEPYLSHPHNVFLHVWVSMGIFGLAAFVALLTLFFWLFTRIVRRLRLARDGGDPHLEWMTLGVGAGMLAALVQGMVDSAFLELDLAFCFWMLVAALLLLRGLSQTPWRGRLLADGG